MIAWFSSQLVYVSLCHFYFAAFCCYVEFHTVQFMSYVCIYTLCLCVCVVVHVFIIYLQFVLHLVLSCIVAFIHVYLYIVECIHVSTYLLF